MEKTVSDDPFPSGVAGRERLFPRIPDKLWNDWRWQMRERVTTVAALTRLLPRLAPEKAVLRRVTADFRMAVTPYYLSLIDPNDPSDPVLRQAVPHPDELRFQDTGYNDPLHEEALSPVPGLTHRYPDRVLLLASNACAVYCRHCTRKRVFCGNEKTDNLDRMIAYIAATPAVRDVIVSGGDPLLLPLPQLDRLLGRLRAIPHVEIIRIGTRVPVTLPQRVDADLAAMLARHHPVWVNTHFNHARECTPEAARACDILLRAGIPLNNQSVLLRGVNDDVDTIRALVHALARMRVRPYYLYQCDPVRGAEHLRTPLSTGLAIMEGLRGHTGGFTVPTFVVDAPGGGGKIAVSPQVLVFYDEAAGEAVLRNFQGREFVHRDPGGSGSEPVLLAAAAARRQRGTTSRGSRPLVRARVARRGR